MRKLLLQAVSLGLLQTMVACSGTEISEPVKVSEPTGQSTSSTLRISTSVGDYGSADPNQVLQVTVTGGQAPYEVVKLSGSGFLSQDASTYTTGGTADTVGLRVTDALGKVDDHFFYVINEIGTNPSPNPTPDPTSPPADDNDDDVSCLAMPYSLGLASVSNDGEDIEKSFDMTNHSSLSEHVIVGVALRAYDRDVQSIYLEADRFDLNTGNVLADPRKKMVNGDRGVFEKGEFFAEAPAGYYVYGFGAAGNDNGHDVRVIHLYVAKPLGNNEFDTLKCIYSAGVDRQCVSADEDNSFRFLVNVGLYGNNGIRYGEFVGEPNRPLVGLGVAMIGNVFREEHIWAKSRSITETNCGQ